MIQFFAKARSARCVLQCPDKITTGSVGIQVLFSLSEEWDGLAKTAVFRGGGKKIDVLLLSDRCEVPPDVLEVPGGDLSIGLYGTGEGGAVVIPTVWASAGRIYLGAEPSGIEPSPQTQSLVDQILEAAQAAQDAAEDAEETAQSVRDDADAGEFDGEDGNGVWWTTDAIAIMGSVYYTQERNVQGRAGATPQAKDLLVGPAPGTAGAVTYLYSVRGIQNTYVYLDGIGSIKGETGQQGPAGPAGPQGQQGEQGPAGPSGEDGFSPTVTVTEISGGHRVTITDEDGDHVFDVMDGTGGETVEHQIGTKASQWQRLTVGRASSGDLIGTSGYRYEPNNTRISTKPPVSINGATQLSFTVQSGYKFCVYFFNADLSTMLGGNSWTAADDVLTVPAGASYVVVSIAKTSDGTITTDDYDKVEIVGEFELVPFVEDLADTVESGTGGGGTSDYDDLTNKPQINGVTLSGNKSASDLGLAPAGAYVKPSGGIPKTDLAAAVQTSLGKADTALQSYTETDPTVPSWAKASSKPAYTASEVGAIAAPSSPATGAFLVWNGSAWVAQTLATWQVGSY